MRKYYCLVIALSAIFLYPVQAQEISWNATPQKGFVFRITNSEAQQLLTTYMPDKVAKGLLHTVIDTFDIASGWVDRPASGHFILATVIANKLHCTYTSVFPYQVFLLKEYDALSLQIIDHDGTVRTNARVKLAARRIQPDRETNTYRIPNGWVTGSQRYVTVELDGFRSVFHIQKHEVPDWYHDYDNDDDGPAFYSYLITDKNKYKPNDLVRFKSYALSNARLPLRKDLDAWLINGNKKVKVGTVSPHRPGSYASEFRLHDSLNLILDRSYELRLVERKGRVVANCRFIYEDYELHGNKLQVNLSTPQQYFPASNTLSILATDVNGLVLKDATANIVVRTYALRETFQPVAILADTLLQAQVTLRPDSATKFVIPSSLFQKTNTAYEVYVTVLNTQNERMQSTVSAMHYHSKYALMARFSNDSLVYEIFDNGKLLKHPVPMVLQRDNRSESIPVVIPYREKINPTVSSMRFSGDLLNREITLRDLNPTLELVGGIRKDSFKIELHNPQQLEVSWYIYQGSLLLEKGFGKELTHASLITDRTQTYYAELFYSFGGQEQLKRNEYMFREDLLDIAIGLPDQVFPGQQVEATLQVNDQSGNAVSGVDLTAVATTAKLNYYVPDLPYYGSSSSPRSAKAHYTKKDINNKTFVLDLDYTVWENRLRLDTMKYYQFTYPGKKRFIHTVPIADGTQFAPFVMEGGFAQQVYVIEVNQKPVYYSWVDQPKAYAFYIEEPLRFNSVTLRLYDRVLILDSLRFSAKEKTILSVDLNNLPASVETIPMRSFTEKVYRKRTRTYYAFTQTEINRHLPYVSSFANVYDFAYLESGKLFTPLFSKQFSTGKSKILVGPIQPGRQTFTSRTQAITYAHTGGYHYAFEENVVYKLTAEKLLPERLPRSSADPMKHINDLAETKANFMAYKDSPVKWLTRVITLVDRALRMTILLPEDKKSAGVAGLLFEDCETGKITSPCRGYHAGQSEFFNVPRGLYNVIILYNSGAYLKVDSVAIRSNTHVLIDLKHRSFLEADTNSLSWLSLNLSVNCFNLTPTISRSFTLRHSGSQLGNVHGYVVDSENIPVPGASIVIKGTSIGTSTDADGRFSIHINESSAELEISFIGFKTERVEVQLSSSIAVTLTEDVTQLSEVVVVGYGSVQKRELTGSVIRIRGVGTISLDQALQGRVAGAQITDAEPTPQDVAPDLLESPEVAERKLYQELLAINTIRSNFQDVALWEPKLYTDKHGQSKFNVTFPDDITRWDITVYAMNRRLQTGTARKSIRSYKPIMAELNVPQFLVRGDSARVIGKVLNYSSNKNIDGSVSWNGARSFDNTVHIAGFHIDQLLLSPATTDSVSARYVFKRDDGYTDGEERTIPVIEQGTLRADGSLALLTSNDAVTIHAGAHETIIVDLVDNQLDIYKGEIMGLINYRYACNEQLASKLLGLISYKIVTEYEGKVFQYDKDVNRIIAKLLKNQNGEFLWSWWDVSPNTSYWMSAHILRALKAARDAGYSVNLNIDNLTRKSTYKYDFLKDYSLQDIELLNALAGWGAKLSYSKYIHVLDSILRDHEYAVNVKTGKYRYPQSFLKEKLLLLEARQLTQTHYQRDSLLRYLKRGILNEAYFTDDRPASYWYNDDLSANAVAYRIVRKDSSLHYLRTPLQLYFIGLRKAGTWNTYRSSTITTSLLPDLIATRQNQKVSAVTISGYVNQSVSTYPYRIVVPAGESITLSKQTGLPVYYMRYTEERVTEAKTGVEGFAIKTSFPDNRTQLQAGKPVALTVEVGVTKKVNQQYVMIEIPIPASCSYADKHQPYGFTETYRAYFKERTVIFCENMKPGTYTFVVNLLPRFTGSYHTNPAQVSLMYFPVVNANTDMKRVRVTH